MNPYNAIHEEQRQYRLSRLRDAVSGNAKREQFFSSGGYSRPHVEPVGSFNRPSGYSSNLSYTDTATTHGRGAIRTQEGHSWKQSRNIARAKQLQQMEALQQGEVLPSTLPPTNDDVPDTIKTSFELFFNNVVDNDFQNETVPVKDVKSVIGNLQQHGTDLDADDLSRYANILEDSINGNISEILEFRKRVTQLDKDRRDRRITDPKALPEIRKLLSSYQSRVENIESFELQYKMYLMIRALQSTMDMDQQSRKIAFKQQSKDIIKASPRKIMSGDMFNVLTRAKRGLKELKDILPKNNVEINAEKKVLDKMVDDLDDDDDEDVAGVSEFKAEEPRAIPQQTSSASPTRQRSRARAPTPPTIRRSTRTRNAPSWFGRGTTTGGKVKNIISLIKSRL